MWDNPHPPFNSFRGRPQESFPPGWPQDFEARMRGPSSLPFGGGPMPTGPSYANQGGLPFSYRDSSRGQEGVWKEDRFAVEEQMNLARRGRPPMHFRDMVDGRYAERGLAPDMDYREREQRNWAAPDVDYRSEEMKAISYRERLSPSSMYRDRESAEYRRQMILEMEQAEREALEREHGQRLSAAMDYRQRETAELEYNILLEAIVKRREREEMLGRERDYAEHIMRERETLAFMRGRETSALGLRERETAAMSFRERGAVDYIERGLPGQLRESADLDLRVKESGKGLDSLERDRGLEFQERLSREYSESESIPMSYREKEKAGLDYMEVEFQKNDSLKTGSMKDPVGFSARGQQAAETSYRQGKASNVVCKIGDSQTQEPDFQKHTDADYRKKRADADYRGKDSSDSDYRGREKAGLDYRDMETADSDYRGKESTDSDYRERERVDTDYRQSTDDKKESMEKIGIESDFPASKLGKNNKGLQQVKSTGYKTVPAEEKPVVKTDKMTSSPIPNVKNESQTAFADKGQVQAKSDTSCAGKLDRDFREGAKERQDKAASGTAARKPCSGDQDFRSSDTFGGNPNRTGGDQDMRTGDYMQKKDEDLRGGKTQAPEDFFSQNSVLLDLLRIAAKELREKAASKSEPGAEPTSETSAKPDSSTAGVSSPQQTSNSAKPSASARDSTPWTEFMCSEDTDYRNMDFNDVDLRLGYPQEKRLAEKRLREDSQPGATKDKDYRKVIVPEGATKIIWLDGLPTGASREEILCALGSAHKLPDQGLNLIGYIPGYSLGSVCVEFSLVEEAVGCMEAHKGILPFRGKKVTMKYIPNSDRWTCLQCKVVNVLSKERCWQCSALRAGTDHLSLRDSHKDPKVPPLVTSPRGKKRKGPLAHSPDMRKEKTPPRERSPPAKQNKGAKQAQSESATIIIRGIGVNTSPDTVVRALQPYAQLSPSCVRIMKNRKTNQQGFGFIDLKNHKEAIRLTVLVRELKPPLTIDGKVISVDLAVGQRKGEQGKLKGGRGSHGKNRKQKGQRKPFGFPGFRGNADEGPTYVYDPLTGRYVDPLTDSFYNESKTEGKKVDHPYQKSGSEGKEQTSQTRRGFTEEETEIDESAFKKPLPPPVMKKDEPPPEPKVNPLLGLIGAYVDDDSEEEEEPEEQPLPPVQKKPPPPPPPVAVPKPAPKPAPAVPSSSSDEKLTDWKKMACLLCRRQFPTKEALLRHLKLSDLHKQNVAIHEKIKKSQRELAYLQQKEHEENQSIQRRLQQAKKELEMLEREEEGARQQEAGEGLDSDVHTPERKKKVSDTRSGALKTHLT